MIHIFFPDEPVAKIRWVKWAFFIALSYLSSLGIFSWALINMDVLPTKTIILFMALMLTTFVLQHLVDSSYLKDKAGQIQKENELLW